MLTYVYIILGFASFWKVDGCFVSKTTSDFSCEKAAPSQDNL